MRKLFLTLVGLLLTATPLLAGTTLRLDCGPAAGRVAPGYIAITDVDRYTKNRGYGWESRRVVARDTGRQVTAKSVGQYWEFMADSLNDWNRDWVGSTGDLVFRADVEPGTYRVHAVIGDISKAIGSIDVSVNGKSVAKNAAAWSPGGGDHGDHRRLMTRPHGWHYDVRSTVETADGVIRIKLHGDQSAYDASLVKQSQEESKWAQEMWEIYGGKADPYKRVGVTQAPYYYCGWPFVQNSLVRIEIVPWKEAPQTGDLGRAVKMLETAGSLDYEDESELVPNAIKILEPFVASHPEETQLAELLADAKVFEKAWQLHVTRGSAAQGENHFVENTKAICWWWGLPEDSPLYDKARLHIARAAHMLIPYMPVRGTEREIFKELNAKNPNNRFAKYHITEKWEPYGDGSKYHDWVMNDRSRRVENSPTWVKAFYEGFQLTKDWCEWWIRWKQQPEGSIGGGFSDDVEIVGLFGYMGFASRDVSDILVKGTGKLINGVWFYSQVDPERGYSRFCADAEHTAEPTGNTLGMMVTIDYGNPTWIERSMMTARLYRDLWSGHNNKGMRHFKANYMSATEVGGLPGRMNDSWICYRALRPMHAVYGYNNHPAIAKLITESGDAWVHAAMYEGRGKPKGIIPQCVGWPDGEPGGVMTDSWHTPVKGAGLINGNWAKQGYKGYVIDMLKAAYTVTQDPKYFEPLRLEYEFKKKYGTIAPSDSGARLQSFGGGRKGKPVASDAEPGSNAWVAEHLAHEGAWLEAQQLMKGREGELKNDTTLEQVIESSNVSTELLKETWPLRTTEAGPTDRIAWFGCVNPFLAATGGWIGGPLLEASVTYENTSPDFAAAVLATDPQGLRLVYHSLAPEQRDIGMSLWKLQPRAEYRMVWGPDSDGDGVMDSKVGTKDFDLPQIGTVVTFPCASDSSVVVEIDQIGPPSDDVKLLPDPGISERDLRLAGGKLTVDVHNVGAAEAGAFDVVAYDGHPQKGGREVGRVSLRPLPGISMDLMPSIRTVQIDWAPAQRQDVYVAIDPDDAVAPEITTFNNLAVAALPRTAREKEALNPTNPGQVRAKSRSGRGGRRGR